MKQFRSVRPIPNTLSKTTSNSLHKKPTPLFRRKIKRSPLSQLSLLAKSPPIFCFVFFCSSSRFDWCRMSIASIKQAREAKYQRCRFDPTAQSEWVNENYYDLDNILVTERDITFNFDSDTPRGLFSGFSVGVWIEVYVGMGNFKVGVLNCFKNRCMLIIDF